MCDRISEGSCVRPSGVCSAIDGLYVASLQPLQGGEAVRRNEELDRAQSSSRALSSLGQPHVNSRSHAIISIHNQQHQLIGPRELAFAYDAMYTQPKKAGNFLQPAAAYNSPFKIIIEDTLHGAPNLKKGHLILSIKFFFHSLLKLKCDGKLEMIFQSIGDYFEGFALLLFAEALFSFSFFFLACSRPLERKLGWRTASRLAASRSAQYQNGGETQRRLLQPQSSTDGFLFKDISEKEKKNRGRRAEAKLAFRESQNLGRSTKILPIVKSYVRSNKMAEYSSIQSMIWSSLVQSFR